MGGNEIFLPFYFASPLTCQKRRRSEKKRKKIDKLIGWRGGGVGVDRGTHTRNAEQMRERRWNFCLPPSFIFYIFYFSNEIKRASDNIQNGSLGGRLNRTTSREREREKKKSSRNNITRRKELLTAVGFSPWVKDPHEMYNSRDVCSCCCCCSFS